MITLKTLLAKGRSYLRHHGGDGYQRDAEVLLCHVSKMTREELLIREDEDASSFEAPYQVFLERRSQNEPISHIVGFRFFWKDQFCVNQHVLDPRADSETLIEAVLSYYPSKTSPLKFLDLGCGTACLLLSLLGEYPYSCGIGVDISWEALEVARKNQKNLSQGDRALLIQSFWGSSLNKSAFDIIVSNPPYIPTCDVKALMPEVRDYEPHLALDGGEDGFVCYRLVLRDAIILLKQGGHIFLEAGMGQAHDIVKIGEDNGFKLCSYRKDLGGHIRVVVLQKV